jgi:hypothetical protein
MRGSILKPIVGAIRKGGFVDAKGGRGVVVGRRRALSAHAISGKEY